MENKMAELTPDQEYLNSILEKFNADPNDESLSETERVLLQKVMDVEKEVVELSEQFNTLAEEIKAKQEKANQQILLKKGQSQGLVDSLLALR